MWGLILLHTTTDPHILAYTSILHNFDITTTQKMTQLSLHKRQIIECRTTTKIYNKLIIWWKNSYSHRGPS